MVRGRIGRRMTEVGEYVNSRPGITMAEMASILVSLHQEEGSSSDYWRDYHPSRQDGYTIIRRAVGAGLVRVVSCGNDSCPAVKKQHRHLYPSFNYHKFNLPLAH